MLQSVSYAPFADPAGDNTYCICRCRVVMPALWVVLVPDHLGLTPHAGGDTRVLIETVGLRRTAILLYVS